MIRSQLADAVGEAIAGITGGAWSDDVLDHMTAVERAAGGKAKAARLVGVDPSTWRKWRRGAMRPGATNAGKLAKAYRRALLPPGAEAKLRNAQFSPGAKFSGWVRVSQDERDRDIDLGQWLTPGSLDAMVDAFLRGDDEAAADGFNAALAADYFQSPCTVLTISELRF